MHSPEPKYPLTNNEIVVVLLGNAGYKTDPVSGQRTQMLADWYLQRKAGAGIKPVHFYGIDINSWNPQNPNITQIKEDFLDGLCLFRDESIAYAISDMAIGYHGRNGIEIKHDLQYTQIVIGTLLRKLKHNGRVRISAENVIAEKLENILNDSGIIAERLGFAPEDYERTHWTKELQRYQLEMVTAVKK